MSFGWGSIDRSTLLKMVRMVPSGTLVELGSGAGTKYLAEFYTVYSIEHDRQWLHKHSSIYIHAPIIDGWYDLAPIKKNLPDEYGIILVDGPPGVIGRMGFCEHLDLFRYDVPMWFDDVERADDYKVLKCVAEKLGRKFEMHEAGRKLVGVICPA